MPSRLSDHTKNRDNNFNLMRFMAASLVLFSHSYVLTGAGAEPLSKLGLTFGFVAVDVFFITSGFLVTNSLFLRKDVLLFVWSRALRILPGLFVAVMFCVFIIGAIFTTLPIRSYLSHEGTWLFLYNNSMLIIEPLRYELPGVFKGNPYKAAVNGSLWTLPWEVKMYVILAILGVFTYAKKRLLNEKISSMLILLVGVLSTTAYLYKYYFEPTSEHLALRFLSNFFIGASFWILKDRVILSNRIAVLCCAYQHQHFHG